MPAVVVAAALAALYLLLDPPSADLAAHTYRVGLFDRAGWAVWDNGWYGGHHLPAYSVLFPPLGELVGIRLTGALSLVGGSAAFAALIRGWVRGPAATAAATWFAVALAAALVSGRLPFALGTAVGTAALLAADRRRPAAAAALGVLTAASSPVAALFLALVAGGWWLHDRARAALAAAAATVAAGGVLVALFPEGGSEPFAASAFWPALAAVAIGLVLAGRGPLRPGLLLYGAALIAAFAFPSPLGGNAARLGALAGGPAAVALLWPRRTLLAVLAVPLAYWLLYPPIRDWSTAAGDPARAAAYYAPLLDRLGREGGPPARLEIPFTRGHWESARVAPSIPLARGWERQLDRRRNAVFYEGALTPGRYRAWLRDNAVRWVALPDAPLDPSARAEAALLRRGLPYLGEVWRSAHWTLFAVRDPQPLRATALGPDWFATRGGLVRVRWTPYWTIVAGRGCVRRGPGDWTLVRPRPAGARIRVAARFGLLRALSAGARCR